MISNIPISSIFKFKFIKLQIKLFRFPLPNKQLIKSFGTNANINDNENINETMPYYNKSLSLIDYKSTKYEVTSKNKNKTINESVCTCSPLQKHIPRNVYSITSVFNKIANAILTPPANKPHSDSNLTDLKSISLRIPIIIKIKVAYNDQITNKKMLL